MEGEESGPTERGSEAVEMRVQMRGYGAWVREDDAKMDGTDTESE